MNPLRETFDSSASRYHRARPGYPEELFDDLVEISGLAAGDRVLEIGPGTGIATVPMARRGFRIHGIELGPSLAAEARRNLISFPGVEIDVGAFETFPLESRAYDLVMSATAFHWIEQPVGFERVARAIRLGGHFAEFRHHHVWSPESDAFFHATQEVYLKYDPDTDPDMRLPLPDEVETLETAIRASDLFEKPVIRRYRQDIVHTPESYADLLWTFSGHIAQPEPNRSALIDGVSDVIRELPGGTAVKTHLIILHVARLRG